MRGPLETSSLCVQGLRIFSLEPSFTAQVTTSFFVSLSCSEVHDVSAGVKMVDCLALLFQVTLSTGGHLHALGSCPRGVREVPGNPLQVLLGLRLQSGVQGLPGGD